MVSGTRATSPAPPCRCRLPRSAASPSRPPETAETSFALDDDCLDSVAVQLLFDGPALASAAMVCRQWRAVFAPWHATLPRRVQAAVSELESSEQLRRVTLWRERRRALASGLEERALAALHRCEQEPSAFRTGAAVIVNLALELSTTSRDLALKEPAAFIRAMSVADSARVDRTTLSRVRGLRSEPYMVPTRAAGAELNVFDGLVRWSLAMLDEIEYLDSDHEAREADAELRRLVAIAKVSAVGIGDRYGFI